MALEDNHQWIWIRPSKPISPHPQYTLQIQKTLIFKFSVYYNTEKEIVNVPKTQKSTL